ncbi:uncharacterized protein LOC112455426 [Temnothorax curvispinosus]|uniref:Uncharacterized protein LOC112455426 n=1 Tax=Temnothorax curvispinosus TaxID=300111 RepID=A0A6J1PTD3_9HYME|nr:uncharacterized protein LOC112455426 [Temnothorax curvispinosus]
MDKFRLIHWNAHSLLQRFQELERQSTLFDCAAISETWLKPQFNFMLRGFDTVRRDRVIGRGGGVAILVSHALKYREISVLEDCAGDFNSHSPVWGSSFLCQSGRLLSSAIEDTELVLVSDGAPSFMGNASCGPSTIDLAFCHASIAPRLRCQTLNDAWGSDHYPVLITSSMNRGPSSFPRKRTKLYNKHTDWNRFSSIMDKDLRILMLSDQLSPTVLYSSFLAIVEKAVREATPGNPRNPPPSPPHPPCIWWNEECDALIAERKLKLQIFTDTGRAVDYEAYRYQCGETKKGLRRIKLEAFKDFAESLKRDTNPKIVWDTMRRFDSRWNRTETGRAVPAEKIDSVRNLIDELFPPWAPTPRPDESLSSPGTDPFLDLPLLPEELDWALESVNLGSSPGLDGIDYRIIKKFSPLEGFHVAFRSWMKKGSLIGVYRRYADDICLYSTSPSLATGIRNLEQAIKRIEEKLREIGLGPVYEGGQNSDESNQISYGLQIVWSNASHPLKEKLTHLSNSRPIVHGRRMSDPFLEALSSFQEYMEYIPQREHPICYPENFEALFAHLQVDKVSGDLIKKDSAPAAKFNEIFAQVLLSNQAIFTDGSTNMREKNWNVNLVWIPSHVGIKGNELADRIAKAACNGPRGDFKEIPHRELKRLWKNETIKDSIEWCFEERIFRGSRFFSFFYDHSNVDFKSAWFDEFIIKRRAFTSINRLRCGHSSLHDSLFRFLMVDSPDCPYCGELETPEHVFWTCFKYNDQRETMIKALSRMFGYGPFSLEFLLQLPVPEVAFTLEKFICSLPIFI